MAELPTQALAYVCESAPQARMQASTACWSFTPIRRRPWVQSKDGTGPRGDRSAEWAHAAFTLGPTVYPRVTDVVHARTLIGAGRSRTHHRQNSSYSQSTCHPYEPLRILQLHAAIPSLFKYQFETVEG